MFNYFMGAALVVAPFFIIESKTVAHTLSQEYFMASLTAFGVLVFGIKKLHLNIKIMGAFLFYLAMTSQNPYGLFHYHQLIMSIAGASFIALVYANKLDSEKVTQSLAIVCAIESLWILLQHFGVDIHTEWFKLLGHSIEYASFYPYGSLGNINHSGALIASTMPFLPLWAWVLPIGALAVGGSAMPVVCAIIAAASLFSYKTKNYSIIYAGIAGLIISASALLLGLIPKGSFLSDTHRISTWKLLINELGFQFTGKGFGYMGEVFSKHVIPGGRFYQAHNEWLELYAIAGLLGVVVGLYLIAPVFKNKGNPAVNACLIALIINSLGNFTFHIAPLFMVFGTCYALQLSKD